jgi:hypothetical protein
MPITHLLADAGVNLPFLTRDQQPYLVAITTILRQQKSLSATWLTARHNVTTRIVFEPPYRLLLVFQSNGASVDWNLASKLVPPLILKRSNSKFLNNQIPTAKIIDRQ